MAVAAVALIVDRRSLVAAYALLPHVEGTPGGLLRLRLGCVVVRRQEHGSPLRAGPLLGLLGGERREDRPALDVVRLGSDRD